MKIDIHNVSMLTSPQFYESLSGFCSQLCNEMSLGRKIKKVQLYSDYYLPDGKYPFMNEEFIFYPLTLIYSDNQWEIHWIKWSRAAIFSPQHPPYYIKDVTPISSCPDISDEFNHFLAHKQLFFSQEKKFALPEVGIWGYMCLGKINISFVDELSRQISRQLITLSKTNLSPDWELCMMDIVYTTQVIDNVKYRPVCLKKNGISITLGVGWKENFDVCDWVNSNDINFFLTERLFHPHIATLTQVADFIRDNTIATSIRTTVFNTSICNYPDVTFTFKLKSFQHTLTTATQILQCAELFVRDYNDCSESKEKIHDVFLLDYNSEEPVRLFVNFGNCDVQVLQNMIEYLKVQARQLLKIGFADKHT